jgi:hypothetical protein
MHNKLKCYLSWALLLISQSLSAATPEALSTSANTVLLGDEQAIASEHQQQKVVDFVNRAITYINDYGRYRAIIAFNNPLGEFRGNDQYIFAFICGAGALDGFALANNPALQDEQTFVDLSKNPIVKDIIKTTTAAGGWHIYQFNDPVDNKVHTKHSYVVQLMEQKLCVGSGYYIVDDTTPRQDS